MSHREVLGLVSATRVAARVMPKTRNIAAQQGLRYERRVRAALLTWCDLHAAALEHNPWYEFTDAYGTAICVPDFVITESTGHRLIIEVKLTYVPEAVTKLARLYHPVVSKACTSQAKSLVICRNLIPGSPPAAHSIQSALALTPSIVHWLGHGPIF